MIKLNEKAPSFKTQALVNNEFKEVSLDDYKGKFVVLFFYPADFTFVCPTELEDMADNYAKLQELGVEVLSVSTDTHFVHLAWHNESPSIGKIKFPMVADPTHVISIPLISWSGSIIIVALSATPSPSLNTLYAFEITRIRG
jgi:peroxiredoxin (alkyl hydroperoxide reductase subunit C)